MGIMASLKYGVKRRRHQNSVAEPPQFDEEVFARRWEVLVDNVRL